LQAYHYVVHGYKGSTFFIALQGQEVQPKAMGCLLTAMLHLNEL